MRKDILIKGGILGMIAVLGGAFGAHALKEILSPEHLASYKTGIQYQIIHAVVLLFLFLMIQKFDSKQFKIAANLIFWGVILFSGSIYILTIKNIIGLEALKFAGPITPIGGLLIISGWGAILVGGVKLKS
jgi:uncharacterized membrane protein YgdD (TMEM256/DUF423 family)